MKHQETSIVDIEPETEKLEASKKGGNYVESKQEEDTISIESETKEFTLRQPPDGGRAWLVLFGCFCVKYIFFFYSILGDSNVVLL